TEVRCLEVAATGQLNWASIVEGARRHRVSALVLDGFHGAAIDPPEAVIAELRRHVDRAARRSLAQGALVARLLTLLSDSGIRVLTLKGLVLSPQLYGDPARRSAADIDLLIDPLQFERARALLIETGYRPKAQGILSPRQHAAYRYWIKDEV